MKNAVTAMNIDIYKSTVLNNKYTSKYLYVPTGTDINTLNLPESVDPDFLSVAIHMKNITISTDPAQTEPRVSLNQKNVINKILAKGYALYEVETVFKHS